MTTNLTEKSDEELLDLIAGQGSHAAFSELVQRHARKFSKLAFRFTNSNEEAEDIVQDSYLKLWRDPRIWNKSKHTKFTTWFYRIILNRCIDLKRRRKHVPITDYDAFTDDMPLADENLQIKQQTISVESAFRSLSQNMQTALNLSFYEGLPHKEAAEIMGTSLKAFQSILMRSKYALKEKINKTEKPVIHLKGDRYEAK